MFHTYTVCLHGPHMYGHTSTRFDECQSVLQLTSVLGFAVWLEKKPGPPLWFKSGTLPRSSKIGPQYVYKSNGPHLVCITRMCVCVCVCQAGSCVADGGPWGRSHMYNGFNYDKKFYDDRSAAFSISKKNILHPPYTCSLYNYSGWYMSSEVPLRNCSLTHPPL